jgi:imidazolonepropionase-like amidohydrolase
MKTLLVVRAGQLFDGERSFGSSTIMCEGDRIVDVDTSGGSSPPHAEVLDLGHEVCILPGLIDAHVHLAFDASADVVTSIHAVDDEQLLARMAQAARGALQAGITTVRDVGDRGFLALRLREQLTACGDPGPEIIASGPPITIPGGHCDFLGGVVTAPHELRAAVRERADRGCELVKVMVSGGHLRPGSSPYRSQYELGELRVMVSEAHRLGLRAAAHVHCPGSVADAVAAGFDTLEHVSFFTAEGVAADPPILNAIVESDVVVSATVGVAGDVLLSM